MSPRSRASHAVLALSSSVLAACGGAPEHRPSVILISIDTLRADHLGLYGYERDTSPYLDRLAEECLVFDRAFCSASWTLISHMTMLTGLYPKQHGVMMDWLALSPEIPMLAEELQDAGYQTAALYYSGWIHERHGFHRGFDVFRNHKNAEEAEEHLHEWMAELESDRPYFLFLHLFDVHAGPMRKDGRSVYHPPEPYDALFLPDAEERLSGIPEWDIWEGRRPLDEGQIEALIALYDGGIRYVDSKLEEWTEGWKREGRLDDTLLIVTADHGEALGQRGKIDGHGRLYQEGLHVPLLVRHPRGLRAGERVDHVVSLVDVVPTVLQYAGVASGAPRPGQSLFDPPSPDRAVLAARGLRTVVVQWPRKLLGKNERYFGVDLLTDPGELAPFFATEEEFHAMLERALGPRTLTVSFPPPIRTDALPDEELSALEALGYAGDVDDSED